jgi:hypothetical protein
VQLGSVLPHPGGSTSRLTVCSNGFVSTGTGNGASPLPAATDFLAFAATCWAADWHDYDPTAAGSVEFEEVGAVSYVTWDGVHSFGGSRPNTVQIQFDRSNGNVHVVWSNVPDVADHLVGFKVGGPALEPGNRDLSASLPGTFFCGRDARALHLAASARPVTGTTITLDTTHTGAGTLGANILSFTLLRPGIELSVLRMPGCFLLVGGEVITSHTPAGGAFSRPLTVPAAPGLNGLHVGSQSAILGDVGANAAGIRFSNGLDLKVGIQ